MLQFHFEATPIGETPEIIFTYSDVSLADSQLRYLGNVSADKAEAVAEIVARVDAMRQAGGLKQVNAEYKRYRQAQAAKAERATPYAVFLQRFTATIVREVAATGRAI